MPENSDLTKSTKRSVTQYFSETAVMFLELFCKSRLCFRLTAGPTVKSGEGQLSNSLTLRHMTGPLLIELQPYGTRSSFLSWLTLPSPG